MANLTKLKISFKLMCFSY